MKKHLAAACVAVLLTSSTAFAQQPERAHGREGLAGLEASLAGLEASLAGLECKIARLERMVATETPVSTTITSEGTVRVYRDGTRVTDSGGSRSFHQDDATQRAHRSHPGTQPAPACTALPADSVRH
ncbi:MAG TPA: hypothetical protein VF705_01430 [Longimicrobium sp.]|jgi:hypothetical protein